MASFSFVLPKSDMEKSKICLSFILLFSFLLSSPVLAYELSQTSLDHGYPSPPEAALTFPIKDVVGNSVFSKDIAEADKLGLENSKFNLDWWDVIFGTGTPTIDGIGNGGGYMSTGKSVFSKDITEADKLGLENRKWSLGNGIGSGNRPIVIGGGYPGIGGIGGIGGNRGWGSNYMSTEPINYKDASVMRHHKMKKLSELDRESFREFQAKKFGMKNGGKIYYGGIPRMEDISEDKKN